MGILKEGKIDPTKVKTGIDSTTAWSTAGLIVCGGLAIMFALAHLIYPAVIMTITTIISFWILWTHTRNL